MPCRTQIIDVGDSDSWSGTVTSVKPENTAAVSTCWNSSEQFSYLFNEVI